MSDIATPGLSLVTELSAKVGAPIDVGQTPHGVRRIVPILGGEVSGPRLQRNGHAGRCRLSGLAQR